MAVAYDNTVTVDNFTVTTLTTGTFTIGAGANRVAILALAIASAADITAVSVCTCSGVSGTAVTSGKVYLASTTGVQLWQVIAPPSGASKTATMTWTSGATTASLGVITATGVDQTTPVNNATGTTVAAGTSITRTVTSNNGDLTVSACSSASGNPISTNQTLKQTDFGCMDIGPGTGTTTHTWNKASDDFGEVGANLVQVATGRFFLMGRH